MMRLYTLSKSILPPYNQIASILPWANAFELAMIHIPMIKSTAAFVNMVLERFTMVSLEIRIIAETILISDARIGMLPNTVRAITKMDFLNTD